MFVFNTIVVAAHRRSGLRWALDALRLNSPDINDSFLALEQTEASHDANIPLGRFRRELLSLPGRVLVSMQELPNATYWQGLDERLFARTILRHSPAIFVHRDGRMTPAARARARRVSISAGLPVSVIWVLWAMCWISSFSKPSSMRLMISRRRLMRLSRSTSGPRSVLAVRDSCQC